MLGMMQAVHPILSETAVYNSNINRHITSEEVLVH